MSSEATVLVIVDEALRFVLYGVSVLLDVELRASEIERLFANSASGLSSKKDYEFHRSPRVLVTGRVDEYEPESVWLSVVAPRLDQAKLERLVEASKHASFDLSGNRRRDDEG